MWRVLHLRFALNATNANSFYPSEKYKAYFPFYLALLIVADKTYIKRRYNVGNKYIDL